MSRKRKPSQKRRGKKRIKSHKMLLTYRGPNGMPPRLRTTLRFNKPSLFIVNAGFVNSSIQFEPTYAYDIDPTIGSTAMPMFSELQSIYRKYRVNSFTAKATVANSDTTGGTAWLCAGNFSIPANTGTFQYYLSNRVSVKREVGAVAGNAKASLTRRVDQAMYTGIARTMGDDNTSGAGVTTPVNNIYIGLGMLTGANQVAGLLIEIDINIDIEFYELATPQTLISFPSTRPVDLFVFVSSLTIEKVLLLIFTHIRLILRKIVMFTFVLMNKTKLLRSKCSSHDNVN